MFNSKKDFVGHVESLSGKTNDSCFFLFNTDELRLGGHPQAGQGFFVGRGWFEGDGTRDWLFISPNTPETQCIDCPVAGELLDISSSSLLLAGFSSITEWMIPVLFAAVGFGILIAKKF